MLTIFEEQVLREQREAREALAAAHAAQIHDAEQAIRDADVDLTSELRMYLRHLVALAREAPAVSITWLRPGSRAAQVLGSRGAFFPNRRAIATSALVDALAYATALHEVAHARTSVLGVIADEVSAWRAAMATALVWEPWQHKHMCACLESYLRSAIDTDVFAVRDAEALMSDATYAHHAKPIGPALRQFERRQFALQYGWNACACGDAIADSIAPNGTVCCAVCRQRAVNRKRSQ